MQAGFRSMLAFWMGGGAAVPTVAPSTGRLRLRVGSAHRLTLVVSLA